jgi:hypothetical protein
VATHRAFSRPDAVSSGWHGDDHRAFRAGFVGDGPLGEAPGDSLDPRSARHKAETGVAIGSPELARLLHEWPDPRRPMLARELVRLLSVRPIERGP